MLIYVTNARKTMKTQNALTTTVRPIDFSAIDRADLQPRTKYKYKREIANLIQAGVNPFDMEALAEYADQLKSSRKSFLKSALRILSAGEEMRLKGKAKPENIAK